jgi:alpha-L-fucosidase
MRYIPEWDSIRRHTVPAWFDDAKFGIFIHWGLYSVPAWAPPTGELGTISDDVWFTNNPYAEWYLNSIRVGTGPAWEHHKKTYGEDFSYERFVEMWRAENWNPSEWAELFKEAGARYVVPVTKHHDGFCLWDSEHTGYNTSRMGPRRDIIAELNSAVRSVGLRYGLYYSGLIDWRFSKWPMYSGYDVRHPANISYAYADYAYNQVIELINKYKPSLLFNDIGWPYKGEKDLPYLFAHYYNTVEDGVVDDRWNDLWHDYTTKEYHAGEDKIGLEKKWEECRGIGLSFGYNQNEGDEHLLSPSGLIRLLVQTAAFNGNLLLNIGPKADGTIPEKQVERLKYLGAWLKTNGEAVYGTRPYIRQKEELSDGRTAFFTRKGETVYIIVDGLKTGTSEIKIKSFGGKSAGAKTLGSVSAAFSAAGGDLIVKFEKIPPGAPPAVIVLSA